MTIYIAINGDEAITSKSITGLSKLLGYSRTGLSKAFNRGKIGQYKLYKSELIVFQDRGTKL